MAKRPSQHQIDGPALRKLLHIDQAWLDAHFDEIHVTKAHGGFVRNGKGEYRYNRVKAIACLQRDDPDKYAVFQQEDEKRKQKQREQQERQRLERERLEREQAEAERVRRERLAYAQETIPVAQASADPVGFYGKYRCAHRRFILHVGPTNSGKTHDALTALQQADNGIYLAPLRLLALETGETLRDNGHACSIITGEEQSITPDAPYTSATMEMLDLTRDYQIAVIDEAQMISDPDRGGSWTRAILGLHAPVIHICTSPAAVNLLVKLIGMCGDTYEIVHHKRTTPLVVDEQPYDGNPQTGDALIAFSRRQVIQLAASLEDKGISTSIIYGALPWSARQEEARRFQDGESKVLVATDAIGMGLNLPIRRIVFTEIVKYDGYQERMLTGAEVRQIAGRAGRLGMFDEGRVTGVDEQTNQWLRDRINAEDEPNKFIYLTFPRELGMDIDANLTDIIRIWATAPVPDPIMKRSDMGNALVAADFVEETEHELDLHLYRVNELGLAFTTASMDNEHDEQEFNDLLWRLENMNTPGWHHDMLPNDDFDSDWYEMFMTPPDTLRYLEYRLHSLGIRYSFAKALDLMDEHMMLRFAETRRRLEDMVILRVGGSKNALVERQRQRSYRTYWNPGWDDDEDDEDMDGYY